MKYVKYMMPNKLTERFVNLNMKRWVKVDLALDNKLGIKRSDRMVARTGLVWPRSQDGANYEFTRAFLQVRWNPSCRDDRLRLKFAQSGSGPRKAKASSGRAD